ncbi:uncharacterized protein [Littorina saxatilis]|uniref:Uncharacterized protein n=1 Tax=Littorina saxatilis TaxID=31220 RepID=A0AAN9GN24_9CAEN
MSASAISRCGGCIAAVTMAGLLDSTVALAAGMTSQCDDTEYYDVGVGECRHCDTACFDYHNGTIVRFLESTCLELCPGYIEDSRLPEYPRRPEQVVRVTLMEGGLLGFVIALFIIGIIVVIILRREIFAALKNYCSSARSAKGITSLFGDSDSDLQETSYVKLADPSDEVEFIDRVTCV